ncbi:MAG: helix-turn-helix domain-containing protein [Clostridia bacterium]|nr:helix-turn-helix domain-containing protein [Clostridia bacterium]
MKEHEKRGYLLENFRLFHLRSEGGTRTEPHYHEFCKLILLLSGRGSYYIDGQHYLLCPGDIVLVGSHAVHQPELSGGALYERIIIYVSPGYLSRLSTPECDLMSVFRPDGGHVLRLPEQRRRKIFALAQELEEDLSAEGFGRELLSASGLTRLLVELGRCREDRHLAAPGTGQPESRRVRELMDHLDRNLTERIDMDTLAQTFYVSKYHMMRSFRRETGTTIYMYLTRKRLMLARQRMDAGMSATEACYSCGFHSYSSFTRAYSKYYGRTPTGRDGKTLVREEDFE